jgi:hypothetical protein
MDKPSEEPKTADGAFTMKLEDLGPMIVNTDGTLGRIPNWIELSADEKSKTIRLVSTRNKRRLMELSSQKIQTGKGNLLDNVVTDNNSEEDTMKGSGSGSTSNTVTLEIEHH